MFDDGTLVTVCLRHLRFIPCRRCGGDDSDIDYWSSADEDVATVQEYHQRHRENERLRGLLNEAANLLQDCPCDFHIKDSPCYWEQLRRRIEEALT